MPHAVSQAVPGTSPAPAALHVYRLVVWTAVMIAIIVLMRQPFPVLPEPPAEGRSTVQSGFADDFSGAAALKDLRDSHDGGAVPSPTLEAQPEPQPFDPRPGH